MKFPVAFRVFASLNIVGFLVLLFQTFVFFMASNETSTTSMLLVSCFSAVWLLVASVLWFFASRFSYALLLTNIITLVANAGAICYGVFMEDRTAPTEVKLVLMLYVGVTVLYILFLALSLFYTPIRTWSKENQSPLFDTKISSAFLVSLIAVVGVSYYLDVLQKEFIVLESVPVLEMPSTTDTYVNFSYLTTLDGLTILNKTGAKKIEADIFFSEDYTSRADSEFPSKIKVVFKPFSLSDLREGESIQTTSSNDTFLYADFPVQSARRILIRTTVEGQISSDATFASLHSIHFANRKSLASDFLIENPDGEEVADEYYDDPVLTFIEINEPDAEQGNVFGKEGALKLYNSCLQEMISNNSWWYFNTETPAITINGTSIGHYLSFAAILEHVPGVLNPFLAENGYDQGEGELNFSLNSGIRRLTGLNMMTNYEYPDRAFQQINPRFLSWVRENMLPDASDKIGDKTVQEVYTQVFRRMVWQLAAAHAYLENNNFDLEMGAYQGAMTQSGFQGPTFLYDRYQNVDSHEYFAMVKSNNTEVEGDYYYFTPQVAIGFWIRRKIDGSESEMRKLVDDIMTKYDGSNPFVKK